MGKASFEFLVHRFRKERDGRMEGWEKKGRRDIKERKEGGRGD